MSPPYSSDPKPALSVLLRNLALGLDAARTLIAQDAFYATDSASGYVEDFMSAAHKLAIESNVAIDRQLEQRAR